MVSVEAILGSSRGLIVAPAGCGKTHLITETLAVTDDKPYLVLTHTTAGVAALKQRLKRLGVPNKNYVVSTIDGWARHIANIFPYWDKEIVDKIIACDIIRLIRKYKPFLEIDEKKFKDLIRDRFF